MKWLKAVGLVASIVLFFVILWLNSFYWSSLGNFRDWLFSPNELGRFTWESLTGPPAAGALAVTAAWIAYTGIKKQVAEQKAANQNAAAVAEETKNKNRDEQWWKTLEWAYSEAKSFAEKDVPQKSSTFKKLRSLVRRRKSADIQTTKETKAIIAILRSLAKREGLSDQQKTTVAEVLGIFANPEVQSEVDEALIELGRAAGPPGSMGSITEALKYEQGVTNALRELVPAVQIEVRDGPHDATVYTSSGNLIGIQVKYRRKAPFDRRDMASIIGRVLDEEENNRSSVSKVLIIANTSLSPTAREMLYRQSSRVGFVMWNLGDSTERIDRELKRLGREN